ncbi:MAG: RIP metalloprotease RseP [Lentisphaerae bacterium]|nr:RIP metalloprotease RseP [Lentisphaerota bacterium]
MLALFDSLWILPILILLFGVTIFVHELGHFLTARWLGLVIEVFSIGFGPSIWEKKVNGIRYKIGCIPFGGYVALPQLDPTGMSRVQGSGEGEDEGAEQPAPLPAIAPWRKIIVSVAGAVGNILLAIVIAWIVFWVGIPAGPSERSSVVGYVAPDSAAYEKGLRIGDEILAVNGTPVRSWGKAREAFALENEVALSVRSPGIESSRDIHLSTVKGLMGIHALEGVSGCDLCKVHQVSPNMSAESAGVLPGDLIVEFAGIQVLSRGHLTQLVGEYQGQSTSVKVERETDDGTKILELNVTPAFDVANNKARIGIEFNIMAVERDTIIKPRPSQQLREHAMAIVGVIKSLVTPRKARAASQAVGGPVAIMIYYWAVVKTSIMLAVWFTGFLNVNLAMLNLLPIPVLDGGHIVFSLWEMIFRRPVPPRFVNALVNVFAILLIGVMIMLSGRDLDRMTAVGQWVRGLMPDKEAVHNAVPADVDSLPEPLDVP